MDQWSNTPRQEQPNWSNANPPAQQQAGYTWQNGPYAGGSAQPQQQAGYTWQNGPYTGGSSHPQMPAGTPPASRGWMMWLALVTTLLGLLIAAIAGIILGVALFVSFSVSITAMKLIFLAPIIGAIVCLPGVIFGLLAARQARSKGARLRPPLALVSVATLVLVLGLLFGGLVTLPRYQLGTFAQSLKTDCTRVQQVLSPYQNLSPAELLGQASQITASINQNQQGLQSDEAALNQLTPPDNPDAQQALDDCKTIISSTLSLPTILNDPVGGALQAQAFYASYQDALRVKTLLEQDLFGPFQPPPDL